jgi:sugar phosphate isomerase/epimerase
MTLKANPSLGLFSVSYAGLWGQASLDLPAFVRKAASLGFDSVLFMAKRPHLSPLDADEKALAAIEDALRETGIASLGLACYNDITLTAPAEVPVREMQLLYIDAASAIATRLGRAGGSKAPPLVRVFTGYSRPELAPGRAWAECVAFLREAGGRAAARGVVLAVQNHHDTAVESAAMGRLIDEVDSPTVRAGFDAWSPHLRAENLYEASRSMAGRAVLTIAADYQRRPRWTYVPALVNYRRETPDLVEAVGMGRGEVDYPGFFRGLAEGGYEGPVVYEMCSPLEGGPSESNLDAKASLFVEYMRRGQGRGAK